MKRQLCDALSHVAPVFASVALAEGKFFDVLWCLRPKKSDPMLKAGRGRMKKSSGKLVLD